jgi:hypothetical protein
MLDSSLNGRSLMIDSKFEERVLFPTDTITTIPERIESTSIPRTTTL